MRETYVLQSREEAQALVNPLTLQVLATFDQPKTAAEVARELKLPRNRVGYHVRKLVNAGLLQEVRRRGRRVYFERVAARVKIPFALTPFVSPDEAARRHVELFVKEALDHVLSHGLRRKRDDADFLVVGEGRPSVQDRVTVLLGKAPLSSRAIALLKELEMELSRVAQDVEVADEQHEYLFVVIVTPTD